MMKMNDWKKYKRESFAGREFLVEEYYYKALSDSGTLLLKGTMGSGKTAIMCKIIEKLEKEEKKVFSFFSETGYRRKGMKLLVQELLDYLEKQLGIKEYWRAEKEKRSEHHINLERLNEVCSLLQEKVYVCIDDIDELAKQENLNNIAFLMKNPRIQMIATCVYFDYIPVKVLEGAQRETIPELDESDAGKVIDSISKTYSCAISEKVKAEMLKKTRIGNPYYISLLVKGLCLLEEEDGGMKSWDEREKANVTWIREVTEEAENVAAMILEKMVDKKFPNSKWLKEAINFLAVSQSGLRMKDLQKLVAMQKEEFSVTQFQCFMEAFAEWFCIREEEWIKLNYNRTFWKSSGENADADNYIEKIKEYLNTLEIGDCLVIQKGEYYIRITRENEDLRYAPIQLDVRVDIELEELKSEKIKERAVYDYSCGHIIEKEFDVFAEYPYQRAMLCIEELHKRQQSVNSLHDLYIVYCNMGRFWHKYKEKHQAMEYYEKAKECVLDSMWPSESRMYYLAVVYECMGKSMQVDHWIKLGMKSYDPKKMLSYYEKAIECKEKFYGDNLCEELYISYKHVGDIFRNEEYPEEAVNYYKKALYCKEDQYKKELSKNNLYELYLIYNRVGEVLLELGKLGEALYYYEKVLALKKEQKESNLQEMYISYNNIGHALRKLNQPEEAMSYYEEALRCVQESCEIWKNENNLWDLGISYSNIGYVYQDMGRLEDATVYFEKAFQKMRKVV